MNDSKKTNIREFELSLEPKWQEDAKRGYGDIFRTAKYMQIINEDLCLEILNGAVDLHCHAVPQETDFYWDQVEILKKYTDLGLAAVSFKGMTNPTYTSVYYSQKIVDAYAKEKEKKPTKAFGGVTLNYALGGLYPGTVEACAKFGGKMVWLPTYDSAHFRRVIGQSGGIEILNEKGKPVDELYEIFKIIAENNMVLDTSHTGTKERFVCVEEARKLGVKNIIITHPNWNITKLSHQQMKEITEMGAYIGMYLYEIIPNYNNPNCDPLEMFQVIKEVGPDHIYFATDLGTIVNMSPWEGYELFIRIMLLNDQPKKVIRKLCVDNPSKILGI